MIALVLVLVSAQGEIPGTYSVTACSAPCATADTALVVANGIVVLIADHTGCFDLTRRQEYASYLALSRHGYTRWSAPVGTDSLGFTTYRSPDAGHQIRAVRTDSGFVGLGHSWGAGVAYVDVPDEFIMGHRIGPPDPNRCAVYRADRRSRWASPLIMVVAAIGIGLVIGSSQ